MEAKHTGVPGFYGLPLTDQRNAGWFLSSEKDCHKREAQKSQPWPGGIFILCDLSHLSLQVSKIRRAGCGHGIVHRSS